MSDHRSTPRHRRPTLFVMVGLPGAGKTAYARRLETEHGALRLTPDEWMIPLFAHNDADGKRDVLEGRFVWLAIRALRLGTSVVLDFGVWSRAERMALRHLAAEAGAGCTLIYLPVDPAEQRRRINARAVTARDRSFWISDADLQQYRARFEEPDDTELTGTAIDRPPAGFTTWTDWIAHRWPTAYSPPD